jgi:transposase
MQELLTIPDCVIEAVSSKEGKVILTVRGIAKTAQCPKCGKRSSKVHSRYTRFPKDLPLLDQQTQLTLKVRRFVCNSAECSQVTFAETFPTIVTRHAQRTMRLKKAHDEVGILMGGEAGASLMAKLNMATSPDTLLRGVRSMPLPSHATPRVLGVDDWSLRKGQIFGTILVDLEKQEVVDVLEGRDSDTLAKWLREHPGVEIISRDRSHDYAKAAREAAPQAIQVADRWHLFQNVRQMLERWLTTVYTQLRQLPLPETLKDDAEQYLSQRPSFSRLTKRDKAAIAANKKRRLGLFEEVKRLHAEGMGLLPISKQLNIDRKTVRIYAQADSLPEHKLQPRQSILDPYTPHLIKRHKEGCENAKQLWRELSSQGYTGKPWQVYKWLQPRRRKPSKHGPRKTKVAKEAMTNSPQLKLSFPLPSVKQLAWLLFQEPDKLSDKEAVTRTFILQHESVVAMLDYTQRFKKMIVEHQHSELTAWIDKAAKSAFAALQTFAQGIRQDFDAVQAALQLPWSNGQTEGQVNKLKLIKRTMYGRAKFDLLRKRVLLL